MLFPLAYLAERALTLVWKSRGGAASPACRSPPASAPFQNRGCRPGDRVKAGQARPSCRELRCLVLPAGLPVCGAEKLLSAIQGHGPRSGPVLERELRGTTGLFRGAKPTVSHGRARVWKSTEPPPLAQAHQARRRAHWPSPSDPCICTFPPRPINFLSRGA